MKVRVYTLEKALFEGEAREVVARTTTGEIAVLENHIPLITTLVPSHLRILRADGRVEDVPVKKGFLEVRPDNSVVVLVDELDTA